MRLSKYVAIYFDAALLLATRHNMFVGALVQYQISLALT